MTIEIASPGDLAQLLRGQEVRGLRGLQVSGFTRLDGGVFIPGSATLGGPVTVGGPLTVGDASILNSPALLSLPRGNLGYVPVIADQTGISAEVDLTSLTLTIVMPVGRRVCVTGKCRFAQNASTGTPILSIKEDGVTVDASPESQEASFLGFLFVRAIRTPGAGSHIWKLTLQDTVGTVDMVAASTWPAYIQVEDIGV